MPIFPRITLDRRKGNLEKNYYDQQIKFFTKSYSVMTEEKKKTYLPDKVPI